MIQLDHTVNLQYLNNMNRDLERRTVDGIAQRLAELLAVPANRIRVKPAAGSSDASDNRPDLLVLSDNFKFAVAWKSSGQAAAITMAIHSVRRFVGNSCENFIPVVAAPFIGEVGQRLCEEEAVCWMDLSGNAHLSGPGLRVSVQGKPNLFKRPGRPRSVFAPKSARIARWLLMKPEQAFTQRELAKSSGLDEGFTSRIVRHLEEQQLVKRNPSGAVTVADFAAMLDAWREAYDFSRHHIVRGHLAARSSDEILRRVSEQLKRDKLEHAATGLAGAWLWSGFAGFRLVAVYVAELPGDEACRAMGFHEVERGENVWLVRPNDAGVFHGTTVREGVPCVHPVQVYLDLKNHPERASDAAAELRKSLLNPIVHA